MDIEQVKDMNTNLEKTDELDRDVLVSANEDLFIEKDDELESSFNVAGVNSENLDLVNSKIKELKIEGREKMDGELEKTEKMKVLTMLANKVSSEVSFKYGGRTEELDDEQIHFFGRLSRMDGEWDSAKERVLVKKGGNENDVHLVNRLFHELIHAKFHNELTVVDKDGELGVRQLRSGLSDHKDDRVSLNDINEAITQILTERFHKECIESSAFFTDEEISYFKESDNMPYFSEKIRFNDLVNRLSFILKKEVSDIEDIFFSAAATGDNSKLSEVFEEAYGEKAFEKFSKNELKYS